MNHSAIYILIALVALRAMAFYFLVKPAAHQKRLSLHASLSFRGHCGRNLSGEERWLGYGLPEYGYSGDC